jgi:hypothetical protein
VWAGVDGPSWAVRLNLIRHELEKLTTAKVPR